MTRLRLVGYVTGLLLLAMSAAMLIPALVEAVYGAAHWRAFIASSMLTFMVGAALTLGCMSSAKDPLTTKSAFLIVVGSWFLLPVFGALPFSLSQLELSSGFIDALFESVSGMTTTGATVIVGLDNLSLFAPGLLVWRALLQWIGGLGIVLFALVFLPTLRIGGMQLFRSESMDGEGSLLVRFRDIAPSILMLYVGLTALCAFCYRASDMPLFAAICNAMTTIATGGFATSDQSFAAYSATTQIICIIFMLLASLPFLRYVEFFTLRLFRMHADSQVRFFLALVLALWVVMTATHYNGNAEIGLGEAALDVLFNLVSVITGTGFVSADFNSWGDPFLIAFFLLMLVGGCAGSTTCSVKIFRYQVLGILAYGELQRMRRPNRVVILRFGGRPLSPDVSASVMTFFVLFLATLVAVTIALSISGEDLITSISGAASALANVGPGLGPEIGPVETYSGVNDVGKIILIVAMLIGRLELVAVFILLTPGFWRQ